MATLFYNRVQQLAKQGISSVAQILGHAAAHEIGHLLLATMKHFPTGIMRANWEQEDFWRMAKGDSAVHAGAVPTHARRGN